MAAKVSTWVWVLVGIAVVGIVVVIAGATAGLYFVSQNLETRTATHAEAAAEFDAIRERFAHQKPLIELDEHGDILRSNTDRAKPPDAGPPDSMHVMAFDPDEGGLVRMTIPFWLLRLKANDPAINLGTNSMNLEDLKITVQDLELYGPTLVLDQRSRGGDRVLVWTQ